MGAPIYLSKTFHNQQLSGHTVWRWRMDRSRQTSLTAATAIMAGGLVEAAAFIPFTIAHGPTSYNLGNEVLGWDMHRWGFIMGSIPQLLVGTGLWPLRGLVAGGRRIAIAALSVMCVTMFLFAAMTVIGQSMGPPFDLFVLAPACVVATSTTACRGAIRGLLAGLATLYVVPIAFVWVPMETSDSIGGFRIFGLIAYAAVGSLWAALGAVLLRSGATQGQTSPGS
jgi:hypothetical protein